MDSLGSTRGLTDKNGNVTDVYSYDAYGNLTDSVENSENDYLFAGEQFDENLDQYYLRQRYYNPSIGRFTRRDTYEGDNFEPITLHKYLYANANPINGIDPSGLFTLTEINAATEIANTLNEATLDFGFNVVNRLLGDKDSTPSDLLINNLLAGLAPIAIGIFGAGLGQAAKTVIKNVSRYDSTRIFAHFTSIDGIRGITGLSKSRLKRLKVGEGYVVRKLKFKRGKNPFNTNNLGDIFLTELPVDATEGQLGRIGVFGDKQKFAIIFTEGTSVRRNNILARGASLGDDRSIFTIPGGSTLNGQFLVVKVRE